MTDNENAGAGDTGSAVNVTPQKPIPPANIEVRTGQNLTETKPAHQEVRTGGTPKERK